jgi:hypothetical protein
MLTSTTGIRDDPDFTGLIGMKSSKNVDKSDLANGLGAVSNMIPF